MARRSSSCHTRKLYNGGFHDDVTPAYRCLATDEYYRGCHIEFVLFVCSWQYCDFNVYPGNTNRERKDDCTFYTTSSHAVIVMTSVIDKSLICRDPIGSSLCQYWKWSSLIGRSVEAVAGFVAGWWRLVTVGVFYVRIKSWPDRRPAAVRPLSLPVPGVAVWLSDWSFLPKLQTF